MFISLLLPFVDRGAGPVHHWVMLAQMAKFGADEIVFISDSTYFDESVVPFGERLRLAGTVFKCPDRATFRKYQCFSLEDSLADHLYEGGKSHIDVMTYLLSQRDKPLEKAIEDLVRANVKELGENRLEAFLTWCNCPSLSAVAERLEVPVIHNEVGPLRGPLYHDTIYFDFKGVNGNTTAAEWSDSGALKEDFPSADLLDESAIRGVLVKDSKRVADIFASEISPGYELGVALQVQDDSNIVVFNRGWNEIRMIYKGLTKLGPDEVLIRSHPSGKLTYSGGLGVPDVSIDSIEFLSRCKSIISINSSVVAEAALWGLECEVLGDAAFSCLAKPEDPNKDPQEQRILLNAFFLAYLVPVQLIFDTEYYRWRLSSPRSLRECLSRHLQVYAAPTANWPALPGSGQRAKDSDGHPSRNAARWTSTQTDEYKIARSDAALDAARQELKDCYERIEEHASEVGELTKLVEQWRKEAEQVWESKEWFRRRVEELESLSKDKDTDVAKRVESALKAELVSGMETFHSAMRDMAATQGERINKLVAYLKTNADDQEDAQRDLKDTYEALAAATEEKHQLEIERRRQEYEHLCEANQSLISQLKESEAEMKRKVQTLSENHDEIVRALKNEHELEIALWQGEAQHALESIELQRSNWVTEYERLKEVAAKAKERIAATESEWLSWKDRALDLEAKQDDCAKHTEMLSKQTDQVELALSEARQRNERVQHELSELEQKLKELDDRFEKFRNRRLSLRERLSGRIEQSNPE